jgi:hypothetical protein
MVPLQSPEKEWDTPVSTDTAKEPGSNLTNWGLIAERENEDGWGLLPVTVTAYVALTEFGLFKTTCKVLVFGDIVPGFILPWPAKEFCIIGNIDVAPTISSDDIATTITIPLIMWFIIYPFLWTIKTLTP